MDAFFVSVELLERPELRGRPVVVGGAGGRGVVAAASYEARTYGVHSAMPMSRARRLCPQAVVLPPRHDRYAAVSAGVMEIFRSITPLVEPLALDEAFLDVAGALRRLGRPAEIGQMIREQVVEQQGITCSVGVASTKFAAKLASTRCKPDGLMVVPADKIIEFLHPLPVAALWGVGERTEEILRPAGPAHGRRPRATPEDTLRRELGEASGAHLHALAGAATSARWWPPSGQEHRRRRRPSNGDIADAGTIRRELLRLSDRVGARLRGSGHAGPYGRRQAPPGRLHHRSAGPVPCGSRPTWRARSTPRRARCTRRRGSPHTPLRLVGVRVENLVEADIHAPPARSR